MKNVWIKRICSVLCLLVITGVLCVLGVVMGYKESLKDFFEHSKGVIALEDLEKGFIPQGIGYDATGDTVFITGYMDNGRKSPIYAYDRSSGKLKNKILMLTEEGDNFRGHAGGLSVYGDRVYIAGSTDACMFAFSIEEILGAPYEGTVRAADRTSLKRKDDFMRVSFTSVDENYLYAGEFHKGLLFYTHASHKATAEGVTQKAYVMGYTLDDQGEAIPGCVYSIPDNVQGACFHDGYIYLSQSA
nr:hypothetical protein [Lachnospiraceae bacterium]